MVLKNTINYFRIFMKVSIGTNMKEGPWGGGNLFAINISDYLISKGHNVINHLNDNDIDIILITEPRKTSESSAFTHLDVQNYINYINSRVLVVHRINECDERKETNFVNKYLIEANKVSDYTVFVSSWLKKLYIDQGISKDNKFVILAGSNANIFNNTNRQPFDKNEKLRIVTHHWGANWNKGFDVYSKIDNLLEEDYWKEKIEFTYIGNLPKNFKFKNSNHVNPLSGNSLADEIKNNHLYITGSLNEPSGNHHIEGSQCGLPVMYIDSGGIKEYCGEYGVEYTLENIEEKLESVIQDYEYYSQKMKNYPFNSDKMCEDFVQLFHKMLNERKELLTNRKIPAGSYLHEKSFKLKKLLVNLTNQK